MNPAWIALGVAAGGAFASWIALGVALLGATIVLAGAIEWVTER